MKGGNNPLFYKNFEREINQKKYNRTSDNKLMFDLVDNFQDYVISLLKNSNKNSLKKFIQNKTVADAGSGIGKFLSFISFYKPKKIISIEPDNELMNKQKEFAKCIFPFLPNKKMCHNIEFYLETMENFIDKNIPIDTICFFQSWHYMDFNYISKNTDSDMIFFTKTGLPFNIYDNLTATGYKIYDEINFVSERTEKDYFLLLAKKA